VADVPNQTAKLFSPEIEAVFVLIAVFSVAAHKKDSVSNILLRWAYG
jgi:hypothetical protein